jgi:hypothetical protein
VQAGGVIHGDGMGKTEFGQFTNRVGGSYGGVGAAPAPTDVPTTAYGVFEEALSLGDGGHDSRGGGLVHIQAGVVRIDGHVTVRGDDGNQPNCAFGNRPGGGSGGSIQIEADSLYGMGVIAADGGNGSCSNQGGGGGGGRIVLRYNNAGVTFPSTEALGGGGVQASRGAAGTIYLRPSRSDDTVPGSLIVDNGTNASNQNAPLLTNLRTIDQLQVKGQGQVLADGAIAGVPDTFTVNNPISVATSGQLAVKRLRLDVPSTGAPDVSITGAGIVTLDTSSTLASGMSVDVNGGTLNTSVNLSFDNASDLLVRSGGKVAVKNAAQINLPAFDATNIQSGNFQLDPLTRLVVGSDSMTVAGGVTVGKDGDFGAVGDSLDALTVLGTITHSSALAKGVRLVVGGRLWVQAGGVIHGDGMGKTEFGQFTNRVGGSYGGVGAAPSGGATAAYGVFEEALSLGDGGHDSRGGGRVHIQAGVARIDGNIHVRGEDGLQDNCAFGNRPGGGSGGSIQVEADSLYGIGVIAADGGNGSCSNAGGGGGGGRIVLRYNSAGVTFPSTEALGGGAGQTSRGAAGTIYLRPSRSDDTVPGTLIVDNGTNASNQSTPILSLLTTVQGLRVRHQGILNVTQEIQVAGEFLVDTQGVLLRP